MSAVAQDGWTVGAIAAAVGGTVDGDATLRIRAVARLETAGPSDIAFLSNRRYVRVYRESAAGCVLVDEAQAADGRTVVRCRDPYLAFAKTLELFHPAADAGAGVHPCAVVEPDAIVEGVRVHALAYVGPGARVGRRGVLHPHSYVGAGAVLGEGCVLMAGAVVQAGCVLGDRVILNPGAVVGGDGFGFVPTPTGLYKIPQTGRAVLGNDVELGANTCVDRAAIGETRVGDGTKIDNLVQVGHGAEIGRHCLLVSFAAVAGSATLGNGVVMAMKSGVVGHIDVGDGTQIAAFALVTGDTPAGSRRGGIPAIDQHAWLQVAVATPRLPELVQTAAEQQREIAALRTELVALRALLEANRPKDPA